MIGKPNPLISVIMGVYYKKQDIKMLARSVQSILDQSIKDFEFLICDDGSSTEACAYLSDIAEKDSRIRLIRPGGVYPLPHKLNACLAEAKGEFIARMDDDDFSIPERFKMQLDFLQEHPEIAFVGANVRQIRKERCVRVRTLPEHPQIEDFLLTQPFVHPLLLFRHSVLKEIGGYSESKRQLFCEDYDLLLRLYEKKYYGANLQETLLDYTLPPYGEKKYKLRYCMNEVLTRYERFKALGLLPKAFPYVLKPLAVGLLPPKWRDYLKECRIDGQH